jgi:hypothetical protein
MTAARRLLDCRCFSGSGPTPTPGNPTPTPTASPTPTPTDAPGQQVGWGDTDCNSTIDPVDALKVLRFDAGLSTSTGVCPDMGETVTIAET